MMTSLKLMTFLAAMLLGVACATSKPAEQAATPVVDPGPVPPAVAAQAEKLEQDTTLTSASGATFKAPKTWFVTKHASGFVLEDPDKELKLLMAENTATDAKQALTMAWAALRPGEARAIKHLVSPPPKDGWDELAQAQFETTTQEARVVLGIGRRKGKTWHVALLDGSAAAVDRRAAQAMTAIGSLKVAGADEESFAGKKANTLSPERLKAFETFVDDARKANQIPGVAIVIVQDGKTVFEKGFGVRELGKPAPVTPSTLFMIGSTTKSLTTLMMARLVDEKKFSWDTPVTNLLPTFALGDADATSKLQMHHTVCACTGLPRQDMEFFFEYAGVTPEMRVDSMRTMKPTTGFGETFQYSNTLVAAGGYAAAMALNEKKGLGAAYDAAMQSRLFAPMGMTATTLDFKRVAGKEHASPHGQTLKLEWVVLPTADEQFLESVRPAGGAWSNLRDMTKYLQVELGLGALPGGKRIVSEANLLKRREPQVKIKEKVSYGLGLFVEDDHGVQVVHHGGNTLGFTSDVFWLPEHGVGVVVLTNAGQSNVFRNVVHRRVLEILFDGKEEAAPLLQFALTQEKEMVKKELEHVDFAPDKAWLSKWVGDYENPSLGKVVISLQGDKATFDAGEWKGQLGQKKESDGALKLLVISPPSAGLALSAAETAQGPVLTLETPQQKYDFKRR